MFHIAAVTVILHTCVFFYVFEPVFEYKEEN